MSEFTGDRIAFPHLTALRDAIGPELEARGLPGTCDVLVGAGQEVAFESCSTACEGIGWTRLAGAYASSSFPEPDQSAVRGRILMAETFELGLVRGMELPRLATDPIPPETLEGAAEIQLADMSALLAVICSYFGGKGIPFIIGAYTPYGPAGACVGGSWTVSAQTGVAPKPAA